MRGLPFLAIGFGGAIGTGARVALSLAALTYHAFLATLVANILGAALIGYLATHRLPPLAQAFAMTGFCGGFTTFSLFSLETLLLWTHSPVPAIAYATASLLLWSLAVWAGYRLGQTKTRS